MHRNICRYMKRDSRLSLVLHALLHMAQRDDSMTSEQLAACLNTNPVVVRRTLGLLRQAGIGRVVNVVEIPWRRAPGM